MKSKLYDVAVIGAGVFGSWIAYTLQKAGRRVALIDAYGPANGRASSGGESRVIRMGYGDNELYTRWSKESLRLWKLFFKSTGLKLFHQTGVLWLAREREPYVAFSAKTFEKFGIRFETLTRDEIAYRYPQIKLGGVRWALLELESGALIARRAVHAVAQAAIEEGADYLTGHVSPPPPRLMQRGSVPTAHGSGIRAGIFIYACGPWLPKLFPELLKDRVRSTRQEVFFFGPSSGAVCFSPSALPAWMDFANHCYGIPDLEGRGFKIAPDEHGPEFDPDSGDRTVRPEGIEQVRKYLARRFPALKSAPLLETRVCQYENTSNGDFLIDRHPGFNNVWLVGGGSGHGFKHGPALGRYVARLVTRGGEVERAFALASKEVVPHRNIY